MSSAVNNEDPWEFKSIKESQQHQSQTEEATQDESNVSVRLSSRLVSKSVNVTPPNICNWPLSKILETLFRNHIPAPKGASHDNKHVQKRKNIDPPPAPAAAVPKRADGPIGLAPAGNSTVQSNDPVLSALSSIQSSLSDMNSRIQALESGSAPKSTENLLSSGPGSFNPASATVRLPVAPGYQDDDIIPATLPRRMMGSAVPVSTGSPFYPPAAAISHQL
ncbi:Nesprin-2 [Labeo rohita]|uniref:Nesprin-2 n=1 Tax=Labeo rohita TaxID=84645 RepID=A0ABQ8LE57_LABRO|nr:Nesprin-2 [Labeo rohita]